MIEEPFYMVCDPTDVGEAGIDGAVVRWCSICAATVWVAPSGLVGIEERGLVPICLRCAPGVLRGDRRVVIGTSQREELRRGGLTDAEIDRAAAAAAAWLDAAGEEE